MPLNNFDLDDVLKAFQRLDDAGLTANLALNFKNIMQNNPNGFVGSGHTKKWMVALSACVACGGRAQVAQLGGRQAYTVDPQGVIEPLPSLIS